MKKIVIIFLLLSHFSFNSIAADFTCSADDIKGIPHKLLLVKNNEQYLFFWNEKKIPLKVMSDNQKFLFLYVNYAELSLHIGINKVTNILKFDIMDLNVDRLRTRIKGICY